MSFLFGKRLLFQKDSVLTVGIPEQETVYVGKETVAAGEETAAFGDETVAVDIGSGNPSRYGCSRIHLEYSDLVDPELNMNEQNN